MKLHKILIKSVVKYGNEIWTWRERQKNISGRNENF